MNTVKHILAVTALHKTDLIVLHRGIFRVHKADAKPVRADLISGHHCPADKIISGRNRSAAVALLCRFFKVDSHNGNTGIAIIQIRILSAARDGIIPDYNILIPGRLHIRILRAGGDPPFLRNFRCQKRAAVADRINRNTARSILDHISGNLTVFPVHALDCGAFYFRKRAPRDLHIVHLAV